MYFRRPLQSLLLRYSAENLHVTKFWYVLSVPAKIIFLKWTVFVFTQSWSRDQQMQRTYRVSTIQFQLCSKWIHRKLIHRLRICLRICFRFGKVFIVTRAISFFFLKSFLAVLPQVTSAFGQRSACLQPKLKHPAAREKNPLVSRVRFNTTLSQCLVFYCGHEDVSKSNGHLCFMVVARVCR